MRFGEIGEIERRGYFVSDPLLERVDRRFEIRRLRRRWDRQLVMNDRGIRSELRRSSRSCARRRRRCGRHHQNGRDRGSRNDRHKGPFQHGLRTTKSVFRIGSIQLWGSLVGPSTSSANLPGGQVMKKKALFAFGSAIATTAILAASQVGYASDHDDGETDLKARALNLSDHFAFKSGSDLALVMYFNPRGLPGK